MECYVFFGSFYDFITKNIPKKPWLSTTCNANKIFFHILLVSIIILCANSVDSYIFLWIKKWKLELPISQEYTVFLINSLNFSIFSRHLGKVAWTTSKTQIKIRWIYSYLQMISLGKPSYHIVLQDGFQQNAVKVGYIPTVYVL